MVESAPDNIQLTLHYLVPQAWCVEETNVALTRPVLTATTSNPAAQERAQEYAVKKTAARSQLEKDALALAGAGGSNVGSDASKQNTEHKKELSRMRL